MDGRVVNAGWPNASEQFRVLFPQRKPLDCDGMRNLVWWVKSCKMS
jgi:hypothetical protein